MKSWASVKRAQLFYCGKGESMSEQFSFPGFGDPPSAGPVTKAKDKAKAKTIGEHAPYSLFFSIFPAPSDAVEITRFASALLQAQGLTGKPLLPHRLHVTLHDLGNFAELPQDLIDSALKAGGALASNAFDVTFDRALSYPSSGTYVLSGGEGARELTAFREELGEAMKVQGLRVRRNFTPHMTLIYDKHAVAEHAIEPVRWTASVFVLIKSHRGKGIYDLLGRWPLKA
jgi:RNA 2',3'-cyclic 3'-phosphodiesterase